MNFDKYFDGYICVVLNKWLVKGPGKLGLFNLKSMVVDYVNAVSLELNELMTELYEAMMDQENEEVKKIVDKMIPILKDVKLNFTDEQL